MKGTTMPKQLLHEGRIFALVPMVQSSDDKRTPAEITAAAQESGDWSSHWYDTDRRDPHGAAEEGVVISQDPTVYMGWSKEHPHDHESHPGPGDTGWVYFELEFDEGYLERLLAGRRLARSKMKEGEQPELPIKVIVMGDSLSWRDLNIIAKTARTARDDAFGKPE